VLRLEVESTQNRSDYLKAESNSATANDEATDDEMNCQKIVHVLDSVFSRSLHCAIVPALSVVFADNATFREYHFLGATRAFIGTCEGRGERACPMFLA
jgi:hypothetical protein